MITKSARYWLLFIMFVMFALFVTQSVSAATFIQGPALIEGVTSTAAAAGTTTLTKDSQTVQTFTGVTTQTVQLPDATTIPVGRYFYITNRSTGLVTVNDAAAGLLKTILPNMQLYVVSKSNGSAAGSWDVSNIKIDLADASSVTGLLPPLNGGTGINGSTAANGSLLIGNGAGYSLSTLTATTNQTTVTNGSGTITVGTVQDIGTTSSPTFANLTLINPLPLASGGTNKSATASAGSVVYSDADSFELSAVGTSNQVLISNGTSAPSWASVSTLLDTTYFKQGGNSFTAPGILGTNDAFSLSLETNNTTRLTIDDDGSFTWTTPAGQNGLHQLGTSLSDTNDIRIARGSSGLTPFDGGVLKVSNTTNEAVARSQYAAEFVTNGQNASNTTTRYGGVLGVAFHNSAFNLTATDLGLVGVIGLTRATGSSAASTITNGAGGSFVIGNDSTNQVITNAFGVRTGMDASITNTTNGVTNLFGYYMRDQTGGSTFDGSAIAGIPTATSRWGLYLNDPSQNYLSGGLLIGQKSSTVRTSNLPVTSAALEVNSTTGSILYPRMTTTQKNALTPVAGMTVYDTTLARFECYISSWVACDASGQSASDQLTNLGLSTTVASNALTISVKDGAGNTPSAGSPVTIGFRGATTGANATYTNVTITGALTMVVSSGSTLGFFDAQQDFLYVYLINNAGTAELAVSKSLYVDEGQTYSTTAEGGAGGADTFNALYSTTARSSVPIRLIGRINITETTAGTWASNAVDVSIAPFNAAQVTPETPAAGINRVIPFGVGFGGATNDLSTCTGSPCTVYRNIGGMINTVTATGTGAYVLNFLRKFQSNSVNCTASGVIPGVSAAICAVTSTATNAAGVTSLTVECQNAAGVNANAYVSVNCLGTL